MANVTLDIPDDLIAKLSAAGHEPVEVVRLAAAFSLCSRGELSTSQAAQLAGLTYADFLEAAARAKVKLFPVDVEELKEEIGRGFTLVSRRQSCFGRGGSPCRSKCLSIAPVRRDRTSSALQPWVPKSPIKQT
jgi:predicted HTH domain antitoxin